jgi:hypothetical protein
MLIDITSQVPVRVGRANVASPQGGGQRCSRALRSRRVTRWSPRRRCAQARLRPPKSPRRSRSRSMAHGRGPPASARLRDGALARRYLLVGLLRQPRRGGGGRDRRRPGRHRRARVQGAAEGVQTAADLLGALAEVAGDRIARSKIWPDGPRALAGRLRRAALFLRKIGIEIDFVREGRARARMIVITAIPTAPAAEQANLRPHRLHRSHPKISKT